MLHATAFPTGQETIEAYPHPDTDDIRQQIERIVRIAHDTEPIRQFKQLHRAESKSHRKEYGPAGTGGDAFRQEVDGERDGHIAGITVHKDLAGPRIAGDKDESGDPGKDADDIPVSGHGGVVIFRGSCP